MLAGQADSGVPLVLGASGQAQRTLGVSRGEAFRTIASLEMLGALLGVAVLMPSPS